jgi:hypothetical protein
MAKLFEEFGEKMFDKFNYNGTQVDGSMDRLECRPLCRRMCREILSGIYYVAKIQ